MVSVDLTEEKPVRIKKGTVRQHLDLEQDDTVHTLRLKMTFASATRAKGWYRLTGGECDGARVRFVARPGGYYLRAD